MMSILSKRFQSQGPNIRIAKKSISSFNVLCFALTINHLSALVCQIITINADRKSIISLSFNISFPISPTFTKGVRGSNFTDWTIIYIRSTILRIIKIQSNLICELVKFNPNPISTSVD